MRILLWTNLFWLKAFLFVHTESSTLDQLTGDTAHLSITKWLDQSLSETQVQFEQLSQALLNHWLANCASSWSAISVPNSQKIKSSNHVDNKFCLIFSDPVRKWKRYLHVIVFKTVIATTGFDHHMEKKHPENCKYEINLKLELVLRLNRRIFRYILSQCTTVSVYTYLDACKENKTRTNECSISASFEHFLSKLKSLGTYPKAMYFHCLFMTIMTTAAAQKWKRYSSNLSMTFDTQKPHFRSSMEIFLSIFH